MMKQITLFLIIGILLITPGCNADIKEEIIEPIDIDNSNIELVFNNNVKSIQQIVLQQEKDGVVESIEYSNELIRLSFQNADSDIVFYKTSVQERVLYPALSIAPCEGEYYWIIADEYLLNGEGEKIRVNETTTVPVFCFEDGHWLCTIGNNTRYIEDIEMTEDVLSIKVVDDVFVVTTFPSSYQMTLPMTSFTPPNVPQKAFYKDVFFDAGIGLDFRKSLYVVSYLGLSMERISLPRYEVEDTDYILQNMIFEGNVDDSNGRLLYPDGQPRYRLLFVYGGDSRAHGKSLSEKSLQNMRQFINNGGGYVGTCAGAFFASNGYDSHTDYPYYLSAWPSITKHTGLGGVNTGMFIEQDSPLLHYYDFGGDNYVSDVRHHRGGYPAYLPVGTEVLARFDYPDKDDVHMQPSIWAYKSSSFSGRVVVVGSHPEGYSDGERRDLMASMLLYALDGIGKTTIKGFLQNGKARIMDKSSKDNNPLFTKVGDLQCHHFAVNIPEDAHDITVSLASDWDCDLSLMMCHDTYAYPENADYISSSDGANQQLSFSTLDAGKWFVSVQCKTTVKATNTEYGQSYIDLADVLNGVPYQVVVSWDAQ